MTFQISPLAALDIVAAALKYDAQPSRLGPAFKAAFAKAARAIVAAPRQHSPVEDGVPGLEIREYFLKRFQQRVVYRVTGDDILVVAVVHASRQPGAWHRQLPADGG